MSRGGGTDCSLVRGCPGVEGGVAGVSRHGRGLAWSAEKRSWTPHASDSILSPPSRSVFGLSASPIEPGQLRLGPVGLHGVHDVRGLGG